MTNINTQGYWNNRFATGDWEQHGGRNQTQQFAISQISRLAIPRDFTGTILDFGCGLGDAFPIYRKAYPKAKLIGIDISGEAIKKCQATYGALGEFLCGSYTDIPDVDIIIASNVLEHLSDDQAIVRHLMGKCRQLNIIVPYAERLESDSEHINTYDEETFRSLGRYRYKIFTSKGWSYTGVGLLYHIYLKNMLRPIFGKPTVKNRKQIIFTFSDDASQRLRT